MVHLGTELQTPCTKVRTLGQNEESNEFSFLKSSRFYKLVYSIMA